MRLSAAIQKWQHRAICRCDYSSTQPRVVVNLSNGGHGRGRRFGLIVCGGSQIARMRRWLGGESRMLLENLARSGARSRDIAQSG